MIPLFVKFKGDTRAYRYLVSDTATQGETKAALYERHGAPVVGVSFPTDEEFFGTAGAAEVVLCE